VWIHNEHSHGLDSEFVTELYLLLILLYHNGHLIIYIYMEIPIFYKLYTTDTFMKLALYSAAVYLATPTAQVKIMPHITDYR
jgi:hypothetical protein